MLVFVVSFEAGGCGLDDTGNLDCDLLGLMVSTRILSWEESKLPLGRKLPGKVIQSILLGLILTSGYDGQADAESTFTLRSIEDVMRRSSRIERYDTFSSRAISISLNICSKL